MVDWIAEVGSMHKGEKSLAYRLIQEFSQAGATTIKFQAGRDPADPIRWADDFLPEAFLWCHSFGVEFLASCWSMSGLQLCRDIGMKRRKIAHQQVAIDDEIFLSTLNDKCEIIASLTATNRHHTSIRNLLAKLHNIKWLFVGDHYPTYPWDFSPPEDMFNYDGYSNHMHGIAAPLWAVAHGAKIIECHVTLDPTEESIKDNHFALTPEQFETMVKVGNQISMLGEKND